MKKWKHKSTFTTIAMVLCGNATMPHWCKHLHCHDLNLGFVTKAKVCKGANWKWSMGVIFYVLKSVGDCEGINPHTPRWAPTLGVGVPMDFRIFRKQFQGSKLIELKSSYTIGKILKFKCLKWAHMTHLST